MLRHLLNPRLLPWHLLIATVTVVFVLLGVWQLSRHGERQERNERLEARLSAAPVPYREVRGTLDPDAPEGAEGDPRFMPTFVEGTFLPEAEVLLRSRELEGQPGYHVLTPLRLAGSGPDGRAVLVDRGWIPFQGAEPNQPVHAPLEGTVVVLGRLMPEADPPTGPLAAFAPRDPENAVLTTVARADVDRLQGQMPVPLDPFVIEAIGVESIAGAAAPAEPRPFPRIPPGPAPEAGPHLAYALQWFSFALITIIGYGALLARRGAPGRPDESSRPSTPA